MLHIVWQESGGRYIAYTKLDPGLDDQDGSSADPTTITIVDDTYLYDGGSYQQHPRLAIDSNDGVHIVWADYDDNNIFYMKLDNTGAPLVGPTVLMAAYAWYARPDLALDSNDNVHITWNTNESTSTYEVYYKMLDGSDGSTLINATLITPDDNESSRRQSIVVDFEDKVHVIWQDKRGTQAEIYYTKLDPSLDDQDGSAANEAAITVIDDTVLTPDDGNKSYNPQSAILCGRYIHVAHYEFRSSPSRTDVYFMTLDTDGTITVPSTPLTARGTVDYSTSEADNTPNLAVDANGTTHVVWCDDRDGDYQVFYNHLRITLAGHRCRRVAR